MLDSVDWLGASLQRLLFLFISLSAFAYIICTWGQDPF